MTPDEALEYKRNGGKLYEPIDPKSIYTLDIEQHFREKRLAVNITWLPATNPFPEDGK